MKRKISTATFIILSTALIFFSLTNLSHASFFSDVINLFSRGSSSTSSPQQDSLDSSSLLKPKSTSSYDSSTTDLNINNKGALVVSSGPMRVSTEKEKITEDSIILYEVKKGDTLDTVAKLFNISKNTIVWANSLKDKNLTPGTSLIILPITGLSYTATQAISLSQVAKKYSADASEIAEFNGISVSAKLAKGQTIIIPDAEGDLASSKGTTVPTSKQIKYKNNVVLGYFMKPVNCIETQGLHGPYHTAVDLGCHIGTPVAAAASGVVIRSTLGGYNGGYGSVIIISHPNGTQTIYAHLSQINVTVGSRVTQGQIIGATGNTGRSTGPHLHFETRGTGNPF
jgi:murein DD-endopeptidase MepM/ murein hydrolase activator NlpD